MYSIGETFVYESEDEEKNLSVVGDMVIKGKEYIIAEDEFEICYVFCYNETEEVLEYIDEQEKSDALIEEWQNEYYGTIDEVGLWEEDYEDRDEIESEAGYYEDEDEYVEEEDDMDSYIDDLMDEDE